MIYVRWKKGESRRGRVYPAGTDNALVLCPLCDDLIGSEKSYQIIVIGPTDDEDGEKHKAGWWYTAGAMIGHEACVSDTTDAKLDELAGWFVVMESESPGPQ